MYFQRGSLIHKPRVLVPLVEKSNLLRLSPTGKVLVKEKIPQIVDQYGIPRRVAMVKTALGTLATEHTWTGGYDLHHMAYHRNTYRSIVGQNGEKIGSKFRGSSLVKVILPRQLHEYMHAIYEDLAVPDEEVMKMFGDESSTVHDLFNTVKLTSYVGIPHLNSLPFEVQERIRKEQLERKVGRLASGSLNIVPHAQYLIDSPLEDVRTVLRDRSRPVGFSNVPSCQEVFMNSFEVAA